MVARAIIYLCKPYLAQKSLRHYVQQNMPQYQVARHHMMIMTALELLEMGVIRFLIVNMPPRHGKSELVSRQFPEWYLGRHPEKDIIHVSHSADLSNDFSRRVRSTIRDSSDYAKLFPRTVLDPERQRVDDWRLIKGGGFRSRGTGGGISGHGADVLIIDDAHKEGEITPTSLNQVFDWYSSAARMRLMPDAKILICMTRWDTRDLVGRVVEAANRDENADQWMILDLVGLIETEEQKDRDPLGREIGESLWPEWYSPEALLALKALSDAHFEALVQQNPHAFSAVMFDEDDFKRGMAPFEDEDKVKVAWCFDLALGEDEASDYTAWARVGYQRSTGYMQFSHLFRERMEWPDAKVKILWIAENLAEPEDVFVFPKHTLELMAVQELRREPIMEGRVRQVSFPAKSDKRSRLQSVAVWNKAGKVWVEYDLLGKAWINEHVDFPGEHDDCCDVSSVAAHYFGLHQEFAALVAEQSDQAETRARRRTEEVLERIGV